jgi:CheY-like chemotaxis protein
MFATILCVVVVGLICGWLLVHWLALAMLSLAGSVGYVLASRWDLLLVGRWFGLLAVFQLCYLAGAALRVWRQEAARRRAERTGRRDAWSLHGERILIVEDEPAVAAKFLDEVEAAAGRPLGPATSVAEAIRIIEEGVDAAVLDADLKGGEALPIAKRLIDRHVPFVMLAGAVAGPEMTARRLGVPVFRKPVPPSSALRTLAEQIRRPHGPGRKRSA